jgi:hypothetical protein
MNVEDSLKLLERYGVTLVILAVIGAAIVVVATVLYREWLHWRPKVEGWINDWMTSAEKTQETHRTVATSSLDLQRSNSITMQGMALTIKSVHERVEKLSDAACPLGDEDKTEIVRLRKELRMQRKLSESRPQPPPSGGT